FSWLEYMPVTHGVAGSSPVQTATVKSKENSLYGCKLRKPWSVSNAPGFLLLWKITFHDLHYLHLSHIRHYGFALLTNSL
ncbi:hypothetical protein, partial [Fluviicola sp.]|uniref:hypothetical protein n=1 Tax=Fluviicola sp. TaxID=1917219 RepID=UPI002615CCBA